MKKREVKYRLSLGLVFPALVAFAASGSAASAHTINYGALQDIFEEPVTTSATGTPQRASEIPANMTIITSDQIRQSGVRTIPEVLGVFVSGLNVLQMGINEFDVGIRGYQQPFNPRLLVLIDGRQVFSHDYSRTQWDALPVNIDDIRQIEVVRGTSSALFGSNATSGVINIITHSPLYDNRSVVSATVGTQNLYKGDVTLMHRFANKGGIKMSAGGMKEKQYGATASGTADFSDAGRPFQEYVNGSAYFKLSPTFSLGGEASIARKKGYEVLPDYTQQVSRTTSYSARGGWMWDSPIGMLKNDNYVNLNMLKYSTDFPDIIFGIEFPAQDGYTNNSLIVSRLENLFEVDNHTFRGLLEYRHKYSVISSNGPALYEKPMVNQDVFTVGGTWLWHIRDDLSWTNAVRYDLNRTDSLAGVFAPVITIGETELYTKDDFKRQYSTVSGNSGLVYKVTEEDTVRLTYGRGVQLPSLINTGFFVNNYISPGVIYQIWGNPKVKPTLVDDYNLGYDRKLSELASTAHVGVFYQVNRSLIGVLDPVVGVDAFGRPVMTQKQGNVGKSYGLGGEVSLDGKSEDGYRWNASYSFTHIHDNAQAKAANNFEEAAPQHQLRLSLGRSIGNWEVDAHGQYSSPTGMLRTLNPLLPAAEYYVDGYYTLGGRVGYKVADDVVVSLSGSNLTSMRTRVSPYTVIQRRVYLGVTAQF